MRVVLQPFLYLLLQFGEPFPVLAAALGGDRGLARAPALAGFGADPPVVAQRAKGLAAAVLRLDLAPPVLKTLQEMLRRLIERRFADVFHGPVLRFATLEAPRIRTG